jgi:hypothetical protein
MNEAFKAIASGWSWKLGTPVEFVSANSFGNVIVRNGEGAYFCIIPEDLKCELLAHSLSELQAIRESAAFAVDWNMSALASLAQARCGALADGEVYQFVIPSVLGGQYSESNIRKNRLLEVLALSGDLARQIEGLAPGAKVKLVVTK